MHIPNDNMASQQNQGDNSKALLGLATRISENLLRQQNPAQVEEPVQEQPQAEQGDPVLESIETLKEEGMTKAKVKKAMSQMVDEVYAKES